MAPSFKISSSPTNRATFPKSDSSIAGQDNSPANSIYFPSSFLETTRYRAPTTLFLILVSLSAFGIFSLYCSPNAISRPALITSRPSELGLVNYATQEKGFGPDESTRSSLHHHPQSLVSLPVSGLRIQSDALLWPGWEILLIVSPEEKLMPPVPLENYTCMYPNGETSPARFAVVLPFTNRTVFRCSLPGIYRHHHPIPTPILATSPEFHLPADAQWPDLPLWNFIVFEAFSTETDVVLFVKGPNRGLGSNKAPETFRCVFGEDSETLPAARTAVTSSVQEVFRCPHPNRTFDTPVKISLETVKATTKNVPSVAYYTPPPRRKIAETRGKSLLCATTMVYNVAKFLREWVMYHASIGIQRFIIYDNESDDGVNDVVEGLNRDGYDVIKVLWIWPKTQEAGFSHAAVYGNESCTWMMYLDVDEFLFSPTWQKRSQPSDGLISSLLSGRRIGQVSFKSYEFGPSNQTVHPPRGVTQGYTCRRREKQRHKSIVRLDAVDHSLYTAIHHFSLREGFRWHVENTAVAAVNHYKYQAWDEFKVKFRRRVSAYVVDWTRVSNPKSRDRTPGLGFRPIEPKGWVHKFCEVRDDRLKKLTRKWFGHPARNGCRMAWQK